MNSTDPSGKICLVTGAAGGLARVMAVELARAGAAVVACDIDEDGLLDTIAQARSAGAKGRMIAQTMDVADEDACAAAVQETLNEFGRLDALVNCAGLGPASMRHDAAANAHRFWEADPARWQKLIDINLRGPFLLARAATPGMVARGWGRIINVTTSFSTMMRGGNTPYGQSKAALEAGTASWADDLKGTGVTANVLIPGGAADTGMIPLEKCPDRSGLVSPQVMAAPILYLCSGRSDWVTGKRFVGKYFDAADPLAGPGCAPAAWPDLAAGASQGFGRG